MDAEYWRVKCEQLNHDLRGEKMLTEMLRSEVQKYDEQLYQARETINGLEGAIASTNERLAARHHEISKLQCCGSCRYWHLLAQNGEVIKYCEWNHKENFAFRTDTCHRWKAM